MSTPGPQARRDPQDPPADPGAAAITAWTKHVAGLGGANALLWFRDGPRGTLDVGSGHPSGLAMLLAGRPVRLSDLVREPAAFADAIRRAHAIADKTRELGEQRGLDVGFVALGLATWSMGGASARRPVAPVLLRRCVLRPTSPAREDYALDMSGEIEFNPVLAHYLTEQRGLDLDLAGLVELAHSATGLDPYPTYAALTAACASVPDFEVSPRIVISTFSEAKLAMVADVGAIERPADHPILAVLAGVGEPDAFTRELPSLPADAVADPVSALDVIDLDPDQQAAVTAAMSGAHLVIEGPPGTGKTQTIAALSAALAAADKRVLVVSPKRAALDAVVSRLDGVGLGALVGHGTPDETPTRGASRGDDAADRIRAAAATLREHRDAMHQPRRPWGVSVYEVQERITEISAAEHPPRSRIRLRDSALRDLDRGRFEERVDALVDVAAKGAWRTDGGDDPWFGADIASDADAKRAEEIVASIEAGRIDSVGATIDQVFVGLQVPPAPTVSAWGRILETVSSVRETLETFRPEIFDTPLGDLVAATGTADYRREVGATLGWWERQRLRRSARAYLRPGPPPTDLHAALRRASEQRSAWRELAGGGGRPEMPADLDLAMTTYAALAADLAWLGERVPAGGSDPALVDLPREQVAARVHELAQATDRLRVLPSVTEPLRDLHRDGLGPLCDDLAARGVDAADVRGEADFVWWSSVLDEIVREDPHVGSFDGVALRRTVDDFAAADRELLRHNATRISAEAAGAPSPPVTLMSPLVVASLAQPGQHYDTLIIDEASQVHPAEAASAIARSTQVVVVGDSHQLRPTPFSVSADASGSDAARPGASAPDASSSDVSTSGGSVLESLAAVLPVVRLRRARRARDGALVEFARTRIYDAAFTATPTPGAGRDATAPVVHEWVEGVGAAAEGASSIETTAAEVDRVVELVLDHVATHPRETLGVIAPTVAHAEAIRNSLSRALVGADNQVSSFFADDIHERFFVATMDHVQGDERDAIILALGFGKTPHGRVLHSFGPLSADGGERLLAVATTRARRRMTVVTSIRADDLDPARLKSPGAALLREFLVSLEDPASAAAAPSDGQAESDSAVLTEFARRLRAHGLSVTHLNDDASPSGGLAVHDPDVTGGQWVAVEPDGPAYAAESSARHRDRLRFADLERAGWSPVRVWSRDAFRDPARDVSRIKALTEKPRRS